MEIDIKHVRAVLALLDEGSVTRAAKRLGVPQSALSTQLRRIENELGGALFERSRQGVFPTAAARRLVPHLRAVEAGMNAIDNSRNARAEPRPVRVAVESSALIDALGIHQDESAQITVAGWPTIRSGLLNGTFDFVESSDPGASELPRADRFRVATVALEAVHLLVAPWHPLSEGRQVRFAGLAREQWATYPPGSAWHDLLLQMCATAGYVPSIRFVATSEPVLSKLLARTDSIALGTPVTAIGSCLRPLPLDVLMTRRRLVVWNVATIPETVASDLLTRIRSWHSRLISASDGFDGPPCSSGTAGAPVRVTPSGETPI